MWCCRLWKTTATARDKQNVYSCFKTTKEVAHYGELGRALSLFTYSDLEKHVRSSSRESIDSTSGLKE